MTHDYHPADVVEMALEWDHPLTIDGIARRCNLPRRAVEAGVEELRRRGKPVVSSGRGIHLTHDGDELLASYRRLRSRALHQLANLRAMQRTARALQGVRQTTLPWAS